MKRDGMHPPDEGMDSLHIAAGDKKRDNAPVPEEKPPVPPAISRAARAMSLMRKTYAAGPGRPRIPAKDRCPCGKFSRALAKKRGHRCNKFGTIKKRKPKKAKP